MQDTKVSSSVSVLAIFMTILAPIVWSTGGVAIRLLDLAAWDILFWRSFFMLIPIIFWLFIRKGPKKTINEFSKNLIHGLPVSIFICLSLCFYVLSMKKTSAAASLLIQGTAPFFILILGRIYLKEHISKKTSFALLGIVAGLLFIFIPSLSSTKMHGNFFGLAKAFAFALSAISIRKLKQIDMIPAIGLATILTLIVSAFFAQDLTLNLQDLLILIFMGVFQTGLGFIIFVSWSGKIPASYTGIIVLLESVFGPIWVWILLGEIPGVYTLIGGGIIILSLIFNSLQIGSYKVNRR